MSAHAALRAGTLTAHAAVDAAFADFSLCDRASYGDFLVAHARALPALESILRRAVGLPDWRARSVLLAADLEALGRVAPIPLTMAEVPGLPWAYGILYVVEGSRLGGGVLAGRVGPGLPRSYLSDVHGTGEWRAFRERLDAEAEKAGPGWTEAALDGALAAFDVYRKSAAAAD